MTDGRDFKLDLEKIDFLTCEVEFSGSLGLCMVGVPRGEFFTTDYTDYTDFFIFSREFALFAVDFGSTMRNPKEPKLPESTLSQRSGNPASAGEGPPKPDI